MLEATWLDPGARVDPLVALRLWPVLQPEQWVAASLGISHPALSFWLHVR